MHPIEFHRKAKGWTQAELAGQVGVTPGAVLAWEKGAEPRPSHLRKLAEALGLNPGQLLLEIDDWRKAHAGKKEGKN